MNHKYFARVTALLVLLGVASTCSGQWVTTCQPGAVNSVVTSGAKLFVINDGQSVWLSPDSGKTWTTVFSEAQVGSVLMTALFVNNDVVFVGTEGNGVYRSTDDGKDWTAADTGMPDGSYNYVSAFGALGDTVFMASNDIGVFRSTNEGLTWTEADSGLPNAGSYSVSSFTSIGSKLFACAYQGVFESSDDGSHWTSIVGSGPVAISSSGQNLLVSMQYGLTVPPYSISWYLMVSTDGGSSWRADSTGASSFPPGIEIAEFTSSGNEVFAETTENGIFRSTDGGVDWSSVNIGLFGVSPLYGGVTFQGPNVFAACGQNLFESKDNGGSWNLITNGMTGDTADGAGPMAIDFDRTVLSLASNSSGLFAGTEASGIYESRDDGATWSPADSGLPYQCDVNTISAVGDSTLVAGVGGAFVPGTVYRSTNDGATWMDVNNGISVNTGLNHLASIGSSVFAVASSGGYLSTDGGLNWSVVNGTSGFPSNMSVAADFAQGSTFFAGGSGTGILVSTNGGTEWSVADSGVPTNVTVSSFGGDGKNVFVGTSSGLYKSTDNGKSWVKTDSGFPLGTSFNICTIAGGHGIVAVAALAGNSSGDELEFLSTDGGSSWTPMTQGMIPANVSSALIDSNRIFLGIAYGGGGFGLQWGVWYWQLGPVTLVSRGGVTAKPSDFRLDQNYPNPFNPTTVISYKLSALSYVTLKVYDILGREVATLVNERQAAGKYSVTFSGSNLASGVYFYRLTATGLSGSGRISIVKKLVLLK